MPRPPARLGLVLRWAAAGQHRGAGMASAAERAIQLDSTMAEAWQVRGQVARYRDPRTMAGVLEASQRAVDARLGERRGAPRVRHGTPAAGRRFRGRRAAAARGRLEPDRPMSLVHLGWIDVAAGRYAEARRWLDSAIVVDRGFYQGYAERALVRLVTGDSAGARLDAETAVRLRPASDHLSGEDVLGALDLAAGDTAGVRARLAGLRRTAPRPEDPGVHQAVAWAAFLVTVGEHREAISFLSKARVAAPHLRMHLEEPRFEGLRADPRFRELMDKLRVTPRD